MRAVGLSRNASQFAGMRVGNILLITALISGGRRLAGYSEVAGLKGNLTLDLVLASVIPESWWRCWRSFIRLA